MSSISQLNAMYQRNKALDGLKFILAVLVVFIHQKTPYTQYIMPLLASAVPAFFMISGYNIYTTNNFEGRIKKAIQHMLWLCTWTIGFFALLQLFLIYTGREEYFMRCSLGMVYTVFFNNDIPFAYHLWYLLAYMYALVIVLYVFKWGKERYLYIIAPFLLLVWVCCPKNLFLSNWLFTALPYFTVGLILAKHRSLFGKIKPYTVITSFFVAITLSFSCNYNRVGAALVAFTLVCNAIAIGRIYSNKTMISEIGAKYSLLIYVFHPFCGKIITIFDETLRLGIKEVPILYFYPIISLLMTMLLVYIIIKTGLDKVLK